MSAIRGSKAELAHQDALIRQAIDEKRGGLHLSKDRYAKRLGMSADTLDRRWKQPETFTLGELRKMAAEHGWDSVTAGKVLFG